MEQYAVIGPTLRWTTEIGTLHSQSPREENDVETHS